MPCKGALDFGELVVAVSLFGCGGSIAPADTDRAHGESSNGSITLDGSAIVGDSSVHYEVAPRGRAGFAFIVNGIVQHPMTCPDDNWEFLPPPNGTGPTVCGFAAPFICPGVTTVILVNVGQTPMAYIAAAVWNGVGYVPGVPTDAPSQLTGVLDAGDQIDITSVYNSGVVAILGSADPFFSSDASTYAGDEGTIPWPGGLRGNAGATQMQVAEIQVLTSCQNGSRNF